jgi:outer membrane protein
MMTSRRLAPLAYLFSVTAAFSAQVRADAQSDFFQPDVFRTGAALHQKTTGLSDPRGRDCPLPAGALSLSMAVDLALCRNPTTRSAWAAARQQAAALGQADSAWLPSIVATGSESRSYGEHVDVTGNLDSSPQTTRDAALTLSWTLYDFGARGGHIASARHLLDAAAATVSSVSQQTVLNVVQSFYGVVAADASLLAAKTTEGASARSLEVARALRDGGVTSLADVLQAETAYDQAVLARVQADATAKSAHGGMAVVIGAPADQPLRLDAEAVPTVVPALDARMADLMAEAARQRPDLAAALAERDAAVANVTVARAAGRPSISVSAAHYVSDTSGIANQNYSPIGIYVTVPIFNGFNTAYGVRQAQALLESSEANADQVRLGVSLGVWNAYYSLDSGNQQLAATTTLTKTAADNQQVALGRYQSGVGTIIDVLTAQAAAANARLLRINAEFGWQVARAQLALALGRLSGTEPLSNPANLP